MHCPTHILPSLTASKHSRWYHIALLSDLITWSNGYSHLNEQKFVKHLLYVRHYTALGQKAGR